MAELSSLTASVLQAIAALAYVYVTLRKPPPPGTQSEPRKRVAVNGRDLRRAA